MRWKKGGCMRLILRMALTVLMMFGMVFPLMFSLACVGICICIGVHLRWRALVCVGIVYKSGKIGNKMGEKVHTLLFKVHDLYKYMKGVSIVQSWNHERITRELYITDVAHMKEVGVE